MSQLGIIIPVKDEAENISELAQRIHRAMRQAEIAYEMIFVDDRSTDSTVKKIKGLSRLYPISLHHKQGKLGKAYSILEGSRIATTEYVAMIDGDLQYPPEAIPELFELAKQHGIAVANRKFHSTSFLRKTTSKLGAFIFGRAILGFKCDVQSGLKVFRREIIEHLKESDITPWTLDMPLLHTARELGYNIGCVDINFKKRSNGKSKLRFASSAAEIGLAAMRTKFRRRRIYAIKPHSEDSMAGAGIAHKGNRFITHTTLPHEKSALTTFSIWQLVAISAIASFFIGGMFLNPFLFAVVFVAILSTIYFLDLLFSTFVLLKSLHFPPEIEITNVELESVNDEDLPVYSILCPLYREGKVLPHFLDAIAAIDWPKDKLEVLLLLEEDDEETHEVVKKLTLPSYVRTFVVPHSLPKTKPKACNYGLAHARGEYVVVYDAEDKPDPLQLKKAYLVFRKVGSKVFCLQSKLNYYNPHHNLLTRLFTAEYSLWFDLVLPGLQSIETGIPLGGTSNHFRTQDLRTIHAWDPFNVTEDCDLGVRLFKQGYKTAIIDSTTLEEANSNIKNWLRQRSRWIKGYLQTYFVHMRDPIGFVRQHGMHALIFQLVIGMRMTFMLINPFLWFMTISYFTLYSLVGPSIEALYPTPVFYMAVTSLVFGNFIYMYNYMIGSAKREHWSVIKFVFLIPLYWLLASIAAVIAVYQLIFKPHFWEKTHHGFHLQKEEAQKAQEVMRLRAQEVRAERLRRIRELATSGLATGGILVVASGVAHFFNLLYNAYLVRMVSVEEFGLITLFGSFLLLSSIPLGALSRTVSHRSAFLLGKYETTVKSFWSRVRTRVLPLAVLLTLAWLAAIPFLANFFNVEVLLPFVLFTPVLAIGTALAVDKGLLNGNLKFLWMALVIVAEAVTKLVLTLLLVTFGFTQWVYAAIPASLVIALLIAWGATHSLKEQPKMPILPPRTLRFPRRFYFTSILIGLSTIAFLQLDVVLAKHFLSPTRAGEYALLSLAGKMIFFIGALFTRFMVPLVGRAEGANRNPRIVFRKLFALTTVVSVMGFVGIGVFGHITVPLILGQKVIPIVYLLPTYTLAMVCFTIGSSIVSYHQTRNQHLFPILGSFLIVGQIIGIIAFHGSIQAITTVMLFTSVTYLALMSLLHLSYGKLLIVLRNIADFFGLFGRINPDYLRKNGRLRILILNWRDTKHVWSGGAEVYIHELAKRWVANGHKVTVFCGNDGKSSRNEVIDGVQVVRRGGFYTVYLWAFLYYILRFRGLFDLVVESMNGVPFFTPLYARAPKFLIVHHIHQGVFRSHLSFPLAQIALFIESKLTPLLYRNQKLVTVSESSREDIIKLKLGSKENIEIIFNGINHSVYRRLPKTKYPSFIYMGRMKPYKNIDIAIRAFARIVRKHPTAILTIVGDGESLGGLKDLTSRLHLKQSVKFLGRVTENKKVVYLAKSWVALQPSSFEGWGITVLEANVCGTPVIASNVAGLRDSVVDGKTGLLVPVKDAKLFAKAMLDLIKEREYRKELSDEAYKWSQKFSWEKSADRFLSVIIGELEKKKFLSSARRLVFARKRT